MSFLLLFTQTLTSALLLPPFVMSMPSVRTLADLIPVLARLVTLVTAKLAEVGRAPICAAWVQGSALGRAIIFYTEFKMAVDEHFCAKKENSCLRWPAWIFKTASGDF